MQRQPRVLPELFGGGSVPFSTTKGESVMNSIVWLVGAVVIVIAVLNLVGFA
jgi:hypothetical protein